MSEKISKISVDGVVYDIASTGGGEVPGDIQEQLSALVPVKKVTLSYLKKLNQKLLVLMEW